jgi:hypothetical protein
VSIIQRDTLGKAAGARRAPPQKLALSCKLPLGEKQKSLIESAKFADQKDDLPASVYALEFLSKHPEVAAESVVWHIHDLTGDPGKKPAKVEYQYIPGAGR